jgi:hypothetical protein
MTPVSKVYDAFLAKISDDEWVDNGYIAWTEEEVKQDLGMILGAALPLFKFPKHDITVNGEKFAEELTNDEIQILACYMKCEWLNRSILTWERIKPQYEERDFSEANMLDKLYSALETE